ncbi:putative membrane protein [Geobacillus kaustophilus]|uniref:Putative membrane protein n=1 Tax=Geobacillus kaustophilus TaxID=1462 RepID=A0A0D8BX11_GEOKU|nr:putative membrane protein [Geobacillus kaustophilus]
MVTGLLVVTAVINLITAVINLMTAINNRKKNDDCDEQP